MLKADYGQRNWMNISDGLIDKVDEENRVDVTVMESYTQSAGPLANSVHAVYQVRMCIKCMLT